MLDVQLHWDWGKAGSSVQLSVEKLKSIGGLLETPILRKAVAVYKDTYIYRKTTHHLCNSVCIVQIWFSCISGVRSSHQPTDTSTIEEETSASSATSAYISATATATGSGGRPLRSATDSSGWAAEVSASSSGVTGTSGTVRSSPASSARETHGVPVSRETTASSQPEAEPSLLLSPSPAEGPSIGEE